MSDQVDEAIAAVDQDAIPVQMVKFQGTLPTGKPFTIMVKGDFDALDALCLHSQVNALYDQLEAARAATKLVVPNRQLVLPS